MPFYLIDMLTSFVSMCIDADWANCGAAYLQFAGGMASLGLVCLVGIAALIMLPIIAVSFILGACFGKPIGEYMMKLFEKICELISSFKSCKQPCANQRGEAGPVPVPPLPTPVETPEEAQEETPEEAQAEAPVENPEETPEEAQEEAQVEAQEEAQEETPEVCDSCAQPEAVLPQELEPLARKLADPGLSSYVAEQLSRLQVAEAGELEGWIIKVVDLVDSLQALTAYSEGDIALITQITNTLVECLKEYSVELISQDDWTPAYQRAVKVNRILPEGSFPVIVRTFATGIIHSGRLMRKQEVELNLPGGDSAL